MNDDQIKINYFVEKITKGVRKQIKGYVVSIQNEIGWSVRRIESLVSDFNSLIDRTKYIRKDFEAIDLMLRESAFQKKLLLEMKNLHNELRDKFMDFQLLEIELKQKLEISKSKNK